MSAATLVLNGKRFVVIEEKEYRRLTADPGDVVPLPKPDSRGLVPAVAYTNASIARAIARRRKLVDLTQAELAKRAGVRVETVNRIESGKNVPDTATVLKLEKVLVAAEKKQRAV